MGADSPQLSSCRALISASTTIHMLISSARGGPYEEALLADIEIDVAADLMCHVSAEVATDYAVPHRFVFLLERHLHV